MKNIPKKIYLGRRNGDTELLEIDFIKLLKKGRIIPKLESNKGNDIEYVLSERQESAEHSGKRNSKALRIANVSRHSVASDYYASIEDALYATSAFTTEQATNLANGIVQYLKDAGFDIIKVDDTNAC